MKIKDLKYSRTLAALCVVFVLVALSACSRGEEETSGTVPPPPPPPYQYASPVDRSDGWPVADAGSLGVSVATLESMMDAIATDFDIVDSIAVAYQGQLILDETLRTELNDVDAAVGNVDLEMHALFSASKSMASVAVGVAIEQGIISGVDVPYLDLFAYPAYENWDDRKNDILLEDVLTMRLGLAWNEWDPPYTAPDNQLITFLDTETDFSKAVLDLPMAHDPGSTFAYNTPAITSIGQAIENVGPQSLIDFGLASVIAPLQISAVEILTTPTGLPDLGRGLYFRTRDLLKFGQLYANRGNWNGQQIVSVSWVDVSTTARVALSWSQPDNYAWKLDGYGYLWWTGYFEIDGQQVRAYAARGYGQQVLMVVPELELVIAVFSHAWGEAPDEVTQVFELIDRFIIAALP
ncbi:MAG: serine hydrolase [Woeseiaceae bacterium]